MIEKDNKLSFESNALGEKLTHKLIIGENYDALKNLLAVYENKVDFIYIDPPYNTESTRTDGNSLTDIEGQNTGKFIYRDKYSRTGWLNMMNERLQLARKLLSDKGVIFISIDDNEQAYLKVLCDEVFGDDNFVGTFIHQRAKGGGQAKYFVKGHDYILVYGREIENIKLRRKKIIQQKTYEINGELYIKNDDIIRKVFGKYDKSLGDRRCFYEELEQYKGVEKKKEVDEKLKLGEYFLEEKNGKHIICRYEKVDDVYSKMYSIIKVLSEEGKITLEEILGQVNIFSYPKPVELIKQLLESATDKTSIILDFFAGSGTTGQAVMELNEEDGGKRQFILCTNNENGIAENITYERLYRIINGEGTKGEQIKWQYLKDKKSLKNNNLDVFRIGYHQLEIEDYEKGEQLVEQAKEVFKQLDDNFELKGEFDIYNKLASLKPYSEEDRAECEKGFSYQNKQVEEVDDEEEQD